MTTAKKVCGACKSVAVGEGAVWGMAATLCKEFGADLPDHDCAAVGKCACACSEYDHFGGGSK